jgi:hypothetical protein
MKTGEHVPATGNQPSERSSLAKPIIIHQTLTLKIKHKPAIVLIAVSLAAALISPCEAARKKANRTKPGLLKGDPIPAGASHDWNLGATVSRGWMSSDKRSTADARQIRITEVAKGSPADGILAVGDSPFSPPSGTVQRLFQEHPAESKFLAASQAAQQELQQLLASRPKWENISAPQGVARFSRHLKRRSFSNFQSAP